MRLIGSLTSPYVRKIRVLLKEKGIACDFVLENPHDAKTRLADFNPLGKVPTLELDDKKTLFDSVVIAEYVDSLKAPALLPASGDARWEVQRWHMLGHGIVDAVVTRLMETRRPDAQRSNDVIKRQEEKIARALAFADQAEKGRAYLVNDKFTLADIALGVALEYIDFRYAHDWRNRYPRLAHWLAGISARGSFAETVPPGMEKSPDAPH